MKNRGTKIKYFVVGFIMFIVTVFQITLTASTEQRMIDTISEAVAQKENEIPENGTCCAQEGKVCETKNVKLVDHYLYKEVGPCPE